MALARPFVLPRLLLAVVLGISSWGLSACVQPDRALVALLLASSQAERWEKVDEPTFRTYIEDTCDGCDYVTYTADQDADRQAEQFERARDEGADVIVLNPVDATAAEILVENSTIPVIAYDRFVEGADYFVSVDPAETGRVMAEGLVRAVGPNSRVLVVNGAEGDGNAVEIRRVAREIFEAQEIDLIDEVTPESWSAEAAEAFIASKPGQFPGADAVFVGNDTQASGVAAALADLGVKRSAQPFLTGQDAELAAIRRIVAGTQGLTVHKQIRQMAQRAADLAIDVMANVEPEDLETYQAVPAVLLDPVAVTRDTIASTVVRDGTYSVSEICEPGLVRSCEDLGLR